MTCSSEQHVIRERALYIFFNVVSPWFKRKRSKGPLENCCKLSKSITTAHIHVMKRASLRHVKRITASEVH